MSMRYNTETPASLDMSIRFGFTALVAALSVGAQAQGRPGLEQRAATSTLADSAGVPHALAQHRAAQIGGVRYALSLDVTGADTARGHIVIRFTVPKSSDVALDFRGP